jgi:chaperonin cofactor prefoldin
MGSTLEEVELRLEALSIQLETLAKVIAEIDARAQELQDGNV